MMINQRRIWTCDARASFYCDRIIGKEENGHYLDYIDDGRKEMTAWTAWTAKPSAIYSPKQGKLIVPLRYEVHPGRAKSKIDLVQRHIFRYRAELFEPDVRLFAVIPMTADDFSLAPVPDKCDYLKHKPFPHNLQPERLIGRVDSFFYELIRDKNEFVPHGTDLGFDLDQRTGLLYTHMQCCPKLYVYDLNGKLVKTFGEKGRHLKDWHKLHSLSYTGMDPDKIKWWNAWEIADSIKATFFLAKFASSNYQQVKIDSENGLVYRTYIAVKEDKSLEAYYEAFRKSPEAYDLFLDSIPAFLQVYDINNDCKLIYDEPVPAAFDIIGTDENGFLWAVTGWNDDGVEVSKYKVER